MLEWEGKSLQERIEQSSKDKLVDSVEHIIVSTYQIVFQAMTAPVSSDEKQQAVTPTAMSLRGSWSANGSIDNTSTETDNSAGGVELTTLHSFKA